VSIVRSCVDSVEYRRATVLRTQASVRCVDTCVCDDDDAVLTADGAAGEIASVCHRQRAAADSIALLSDHLCRRINS